MKHFILRLHDYNDLKESFEGYYLVVSYGDMAACAELESWIKAHKPDLHDYKIYLSSLEEMQSHFGDSFEKVLELVYDVDN